MNLLDRLSFRAKVFLGPGAALVLFIAFGAFVWFTLKAQQARIQTDLVARMQSLEKIQGAERSLADAHSSLFRALSALRTNAKPEIVDQALNTYRQQVAGVRTLADASASSAAGADAQSKLLKQVVDSFRAYAAAGKDVTDGASADINMADMFMQGADEKFGVLSKQLAQYSGLQREHADAAVQALMASQDRTRLTLVLVLAASIALTVVLAWLAARNILRQIGETAAAAGRVAAGDLEVRLEPSGRDDVARLQSATQQVVQTLRAFVSAQQSLAAEHEAGRVSARMRAEDFPGAYGDIGRQVNTLIDGHVKVQDRVMEVMAAYARGDFSQQIEPLPGERAKVKQALDAVRDNLKGVNQELGALVAAAGRGEFDARGDAAKFEHTFREMVEGLNRLMQTNERALSDIGVVVGALAKGDLTQKVANEYAGMLAELKDGTNTTVEQLTGIVGQIKEAVESINVASKEIASGNTDLSQRTEEQASSLEETASSMEELTGTVKQNAENARQANQLAAGASEVAVRGGDVVRQVVSTMSGISESSKKIADIIGVIDGIAFQTNILALNAAVEAARAGEQGRGFAVVASEVRNLAQRSASAAKEIKGLIHDSVDKVETGTRLVDEAGKTMDEIVTSVKRVTDIMAEITAASQEQSSGIEQVNTAITQMDQVTQQNAALVEEAAAAAESLEEQARALATAVSVFKVAQGAAVAVAAAPRPAAAPAKVTPLPKAAPRPAPKAPAPKAPAPKAKAAAAAEEQWEEF